MKRLLVRPRAPVSLIHACPWACEVNSNSYWSDQAGLLPRGAGPAWPARILQAGVLYHVKEELVYLGVDIAKLFLDAAGSTRSVALKFRVSSAQLPGKKARKGIFITTSDFHDNAREYAATLHQKLVLIDGRRLAELMIEHNIGVAPEQPYINQEDRYRLFRGMRNINFKTQSTDYLDKSSRGNVSQFFIAGKLCRRGYSAVITLGNTPNVDILCSNREGHGSRIFKLRHLFRETEPAALGRRQCKMWGRHFFGY
jgi:hypothetical protein